MRTLALGFGVAALLVACDGRRGELREWTPEDHQPPPSVAPQGQAAPQETGDPKVRAAQALWTMRCASCHGPTGAGDGDGRPPGAAIPDMTTAAFHEARTDAQIAEVIEKGRGLMPAFGDQLSAQGIEALVNHVRSLRR